MLNLSSFRNRYLLIVLGGLTLLLAFSMADGQEILLYQKDGTAAGGELGRSLAGAGDVNGDGKPDFIAGAPRFGSPGLYAGIAYVYSGATGSLLYRKDGAAANDYFGWSVAGVGDANGDGKSDFIVGARFATSGGPANTGTAYLYSGQDGSLLIQKSGGSSGEEFGATVGRTGDLNGDDKADFIVGAPGASPGGLSLAGSILVFSGTDGTLLYQKDGTGAGGELGRSASGAGDVNGDGTLDFLAGAPRFSSGPSPIFNAGAAYVYSGATGSLLYRKDGAAANDYFGWSVAGVGDANGDGKSDFIVGARFANSGGTAYLYSGQDGTVLFQQSGSSYGEEFGATVGDAGDINGDGKADFIVGAPGTSPGGVSTAGSVLVFSGADGSLLFQKDGTGAGGELGRSAAGAGDVNGDGKLDFLAGAPRFSTIDYQAVGLAQVFSGADGTVLHQKTGTAEGDFLGSSADGIGDVDGDGISDFIVSAPDADPGGLNVAGSAYVYSGATGILLYQVDGTFEDVLGWTVAEVGDADGDGKADFIVGAPLADPGGLSEAGSAYVYSGASGTLLHQIDGLAAGDEAGFTVGGAGDVDGDGKADFIVGAPSILGGGPGSISVYSGASGALLYQKNGAVSGDNFGFDVDGAGDVDGDGKADFIVGARFVSQGGEGFQAGLALVFSGADGAVLHQKTGAAPQNYFGSSSDGVGDVDGDGISDFIVSAPNADPGGVNAGGSAYVYSGSTGNLLYQIDGGLEDVLGWTVAGVGDADGDGRADFIVGAPLADPGGLSEAGSAYVYSGASGALLYRKDGAAAGDEVGFTVAGAGDVDGDGRADFIVGAPSILGGGPGSISVYSGANGALLYQKNGAVSGDNFGFDVDGAGDVDGDGKADFIVGARFASAGAGYYAGLALVFSGADGTVLHQKTGASGDFLGASADGVGDVDGDGISDFIISAPDADPGGLNVAGSAYVYSGATSNLLYQVDGTFEDVLGWTVAGAGDVDGDERSDFIVGAPLADPGGRSEAGSAYVYSGASGALLYRKDGAASGDEIGFAVGGAGDVDGDGKADFIVGAPSILGGGPGSISVYSGASGALLYQKNGTSPGDNFGFDVDGAGDVDGDGKADFITGARYVNSGAGAAYVYSGATGALLYQKNGGAAGDYFGWSVAGAGDADRNGKDDFIVGARFANSAGTAYLYSGQNGALLLQKSGATFGEEFGATVGGLGDVNGDGYAEFLVGAPAASPNGQSAAGSVFVYSLNCSDVKGDLNNDGGLTTSDVVSQLNCVFRGSGDCGLCFADVNCDGALSPADLVIELNGVFLNQTIACNP